MIINTRPIEVAARTADHWRGIEVKACPLLEYVAVPIEPRVFDEADALVLTSQFAVLNLAQEVDRTLPVYAVGDVTAKAAQRTGFVNITAAAGTAADLEKLIQTAPFERGIYLSAQHVSRDLSADFPERIKRVIGYEMHLAPRLSDAAVDAICNDRNVTIPFYSPRAFKRFEDLLHQHDITQRAQHIVVAGIHPRVFKGQRLSYLKQAIASVASGAALSQLTAQLGKAPCHA